MAVKIPAFEALSPEAQERAVASVARMVRHMRDDIIPAMDRLGERLQAIGVAFRDVEPGTEDPRERALRARRTRSTGPSRNPFTHRGTP